MSVKEIKKISFGILSSKEIEAFSVAEITSSKNSIIDDNLLNTVYDPRMGSLKYDLICETCNLDGARCCGHFGFVRFALPVINPIFLQHTLAVLKCICFQCHELLVNEERAAIRGFLKYKKSKRFLHICEYLKKNNFCLKCSLNQPNYKIIYNENLPEIYQYYDDFSTKVLITVEEVAKRFDNLTDEDVFLLGFNPELTHPKNYILRNFPILPTCCRPFAFTEDLVCDDDLTYQLLEIVKNNNMIRNDPTNIKYQNNLLFRIQTYFNNSQKKAKHATTGRPIKGIKERISGKEGQIRNNLLGKRTDQSGRTVIGPDPCIDLETIVLPTYMANILTIPMYVNKQNIEIVEKMMEKNQINYIVKKDGKKINIKMFLRYMLRHGDILIFPNGHREIIKDTRRQLTDEEASTIVVVHNGEVISLKETIKPELNIGDVVHRKLKDGDYVMLNRQPTLHKASMMAFKIKVLDVKTIMLNPAVTKPFNCDFDGDEMNVHVPQSIDACVELQTLSTPRKCLINSQSGKPNICIVQDSLSAAFIITKFGHYPLPYDTYLRIISCVYNSNKVLIKRPVYKNLIDYILPKNLYVNEKDLTILDGFLVKGILTKQFLGSSNTSLIKIINFELGKECCIRFVNDLQRVCTEFLLYRGFTINAEDCLQNEDTSKIITKCFQEAETHKMNIQHPQILENKIISCLSKARDIGLRIASNAFSENNNFKITVESGSKGDYFNIAQITGLLGQQTLVGNRIKKTLNNGLRSLVHYPLQEKLSIEDEYKSRGFITNSFEKGLDPVEFFFHAMSGRKGVCDTAMSTATSGYNMRRMVKLTEDIVIQYDGTVRDKKRIYEMAYNEHGYDPVKLYKDNICNVKNIWKRIENKQ